MVVAMSAEKKELIKRIQEAVGRSSQRLRILKEINKKESANELIERLNIPQPTFSKAITRFHEVFGLIKPVGKKDNSQVFEKIASLKQINSLDRCVQIDTEESKEEISSKKIIVKPIIPSSIPFLDSKIEQDAKKMAEGPYVSLYLLENSIRKFIVALMLKEYGSGWWQVVAKDKDILSKVNNRKRLEGINKWHVPRGEHELFYTDLEDLTYFLNKEKNKFKNYLDVELWTTIIKKMVKLSRNIIDHHNPLPKREINRLNEILEDWRRQMTDIKI
ncbi:MAG: Swt1 family HEPN domain-containing protein [Candidatus Aenigmatarchaeota archaeon]